MSGEIVADSCCPSLPSPPEKVLPVPCHVTQGVLCASVQEGRNVRCGPDHVVHLTWLPATVHRHSVTCCAGSFRAMTAWGDDAKGNPGG